MKRITTTHESSQLVADTAVYLFDDWFDPIEAAVRQRVRGFIQAMIEGELDGALRRPRYGRRPKSADCNAREVTGHRHGHRSRSLMGGLGRVEIEVPRARLAGAGGRTTEWNSQVLRAYQRRTLAADAVIASTYLHVLARTCTYLDVLGRTWPAPTRAGCAAPWRRCSAAP